MGRVSGAPVVVSTGSLLTAAVLTFVLAPVVTLRLPVTTVGGVLVAAVVVLALYASTFLHEAAHAAVGRRHGLVPHEIAFTLLGGHTRYGSAAARPAAGAAVAAAGPVVNLLIAAVAGALLAVLPAGTVLGFVVGAVALTNGALGLFNLLPGLPLDGGHVLEALVWKASGRRRAGTVAAAWGGRVIAVGLVAYGILPAVLRGGTPSLITVIWTLLVAGFIWTGAGQAAAAARRTEVVDGLTVRGLMTPAVVQPFSATLADLGPVGPSSPAVVLLSPDGRPAAYVDPAAVAAVPAGAAATTPLTAVAVPIPVGAVVDAGLVGPDAVAAVAAIARTAPVMAVVDEAGRVVGLLRTQDVISAMRGAT